MILRIVGYAFVVAAFVITVFVLYRDSSQSEATLIYSPAQTLAALWNQYKLNDLEPGTYRTLDKSRNNITTSEGQSYTMLRAVWMGDKDTFDKEWSWTESNLARTDDHLFAWLYGQRADGSWGILTAENGQNSASDADTNIALALVFAYARWQDPQYLTSAHNIINDIWDKEVMPVDDSNAYLLADNLEKTSASPTALVNPSYLNPAAYRIFAEVDPTHPWQDAVNGSYTIIRQSSTAHLRAGMSVNLPPDWIAVNKITGGIEAPASSGTDTNFGYDALRVPWQLALDWSWFHDPRDKEVLDKFSFLSNAWQSEGKLAATYAHDGSTPAAYDYQTPAMYGGAIGYFMVAKPSEAADVYERKLAYLFMPDWSGWRQPLSYYDDNWAWFGIGLYSGLLPNLAANLPSSLFSYNTQ